MIAGHMTIRRPQRAFPPRAVVFCAAFIVVLVVTRSLAHAAQGSTASIRVEVTLSGQPVAGASVTAGSGPQATTDASGVASLTVSPGEVALVATKSGFQPAKGRVEVAAGDARTVRLTLEPPITNDGTIVTSTRTNRRLDDQAVPVAMLGRDRIDARTPTTPGDITALFNEMSGVRTQNTSPVLGTTILRIQGLPGRYTRLLSDGVHLYSDRPGGHALLRIPAMDIGHVELLKGAAGAFYGSDSPAGAVNLVSRRPVAQSDREFLFSQSAQGQTDGLLWLATPANNETRHWSSTFLASVHRQDERDGDDDGWSDLPGYRRMVARPRVMWQNGRGRTISGVATVTFEKREGGSDFAREQLETKTADGAMFGQIVLGNGYILGGSGALFVQSRTRDFPDIRERDRMQTATIELTLRRASPRHTWLGGIASDWYAVRSVDALPTTYVSTRPGIFFHDDFSAASWLLLSGSVRFDYHNLYDLLVSPRGSVLFRGEKWSAGVTAAQGYYTPRPLTDETEAAGITPLTISASLEKETARHVSGNVSYKAGGAGLTLTVFRSTIEDPAQVDRATYTLRTEQESIKSTGFEILGSLRRSAFSLQATYMLAETRELYDLSQIDPFLGPAPPLPLTPRHSGRLLAAAEGSRGSVAVEVLFTGSQRLENNPYRSTSEAYTTTNLLGEYRFGKWGVFVNADNLTDVRQTNWDPIQRPSRDIDGRWTVDAWAPLRGRVINFGIRAKF
jgi:iron complex outermembrane receptor protein